MKKPITIKLFSALLNLLTFIILSIFFLFNDNLHQSGDSRFFFILTLPLAIALALIGGSILNILRTNDHTLRIFMIFIISILVTAGWICFIFYMWGGFQNHPLQILEMPLVYFWTAGSFIQLLFLDRKLPKQTENANPVKLIFSILIFPLVLVALYFIIMIMDNYWSSLNLNRNKTVETVENKNDYLLKVYNSSDAIGYINEKGDTVIPAGKYLMCFTDTFRTYAIVADTSGIIGIDRQENILYQVYQYDNGPDYPAEGFFRIIDNDKIGYADLVTGKIIIAPQFKCASPFEDGVAEVSTDCKKIPIGEYFTWESDHWYYIDKKGNKVAPPKTEE